MNKYDLGIPESTQQFVQRRTILVLNKKRLFVLACFTVGLTLLPVGASYANNELEATAPKLQTFTVDVNGETEFIETNLPWKLVNDDNGETQLYVGPGVVDQEFDDEVVASWDGPEETDQVTLAAGAWSCQPHSVGPSKSGSQLKGYIGASCTGQMPTWRQHWQFERDGISLTGWKKYSPTKTTSWTAAQAQGTDVYAQCSSSQNVTRAYTTYHRGEATGGYFWSWHRSPNSDRMNCGNSSPF